MAKKKVTPKTVEEQVLDSKTGDDFFEKMERGVESAIFDDAQKAPEPQQPAVVEDKQVTADSTPNEIEDLQKKLEIAEKRYGDSSREAQRLAKKVKEDQNYSSVLEVLKKDPGAVAHMKEYLETGGKPSEARPALSEDFVFDPDEALRDAKSTSAQVFNDVVRSIVKEETGNVRKETADMMAKAAEQREQEAHDQQMAQEAAKWREQNNMSEEDFNNMMAKADDIKIDYDIINDIVNRDKATEKIANDQRQRVRQQMEKANAMPESPIASNSAADVEDVTPERKVLETLKRFDSAGLDENSLFDQ
tara:strand:- start:16193 stop:17107 length:915 start_codon:yes stop_codon:yes gene_type:complete